jgi:hypothetical protein
MQLPSPGLTALDLCAGYVMAKGCLCVLYDISAWAAKKLNGDPPNSRRRPLVRKRVKDIQSKQ